MSAWICSDNHINTIVAFACARSLVFTYKGNLFDVRRYPQFFATALLDENYRSVNHRYSTSEHRAIIYAGFEPGAVAPEYVYAQLECYDYQACECRDYADTLACMFAHACMGEIRDMTGKDEKAIKTSAAYKAAPWGID